MSDVCWTSWMQIVQRASFPQWGKGWYPLVLQHRVAGPTRLGFLHLQISIVSSPPAAFDCPKLNSTHPENEHDNGKSTIWADIFSIEHRDFPNVILVFQGCKKRSNLQGHPKKNHWNPPTFRVFKNSAKFTIPLQCLDLQLHIAPLCLHIIQLFLQGQLLIIHLLTW